MYLFCVRGESLAFASAGHLADQDVQHLLAQHTLALALEDVARVLLDGRLAHHSHRAVAGPAGEGGPGRGHADGFGRRHVQVLRDDHIDVARRVLRRAVGDVALRVGVG